MIDWITARLPYPDACLLPCGSVCSISPDGQLEWEVKKRISVKGSHDQQIALRRYDDVTIEVSGNPVKFLQGHNIFGSDDLIGLTRDAVVSALSALDMTVCQDTLNAWEAGLFTLTRVDVNYSYFLNSKEHVLAFLRQAEQCGTLQYRGQGMFKSSTLYYGMGSRRWSLKLYSKGYEIKAKGHELPAGLSVIPALTEWADKALRIELQLRSLELKALNLHTGISWILEETPNIVYNSKVKGLSFAGEEMDNIDIETIGADLPSKLKTTFLLWKNGEDLRSFMARNTFYRHRRELLAYGVDIRTIRDTGKAPDNVVPLFKVVSITPAPVPDWAKGTDLFYEPNHGLRLVN